MDGCITDSYSLFEPILLIIIGRAKAISTEEAVCIPNVPVKISMLNPSANEEIRSNHPDTSKGSNKIK